jgi:hypothetical protein
MHSSIALQEVPSRIYRIRGQQVMLSMELARLYGVPPKVLMQAVKRNRERFPHDFMFQLTWLEFDHLKSQIVTSSWGGLRRASPYAFTEQGVAMVSTVLRSRRAIQVNIAIMRVFVKIRHALSSNRDLKREMEKLAGKVNMHDTDIRLLWEDVRRLAQRADPPPTFRIKGFK